MLLTFGPFELDDRRFELRRAGEPVAVQPKVLDFIMYLAKTRDRLVSKEEIFAAVWDGVVVTEASLSKAVSEARRVLHDSASDPRIIRTVHGKGFRFVVDARELPM